MGRSVIMSIVLLAVALCSAACASRAAAPESTAPPMLSPTFAATSVTTEAATLPTAAAEPTSAFATAAASPIPGTQPAMAVYRGSASRRMVALTFDAGSDSGYTALILQTLEHEGVRASFVLTGLWVEQNRALALSIAAAGHQLINHTYHHASFTGFSSGMSALTADERTLELQRTETTIYHLTSRSTRPYFRPPYGDIDASVLRDAGAAGYGTVLMWTVDTLGWKGESEDGIVQRALTQAESGAIYVMHVGSQSRDAAALPRIIEGLRADGYAFGTVQDVLAP